MEATMEVRDREERRRTLRLRRSSLTSLKLEGIDRPAIKIAEDKDEYLRSFKLAYREYLKSGYLAEDPSCPYLFSVYSLLPETCIFIFKSHLDVVSSLTEIFDTEIFGLPMDVIYRPEIDSLREKDRIVVELSSFVTHSKYRWRNIMIYLTRAMFFYSRMNCVNDICITVNPKHVPFYKRIFLFDTFGPERMHPGVKAPAVLMRINMDDIEDKLSKKYAHFQFDEDLHRFFCRTTIGDTEKLDHKICTKTNTLRPQEIKDIIEKKPQIIRSLNSEQENYVHKHLLRDL